MSILDEAEQINIKTSQERITGETKEVDAPSKELSFYELLRFFGITSQGKLKNPEVLEKVQTVYEYLKDADDILTEARNLNSKLGNPLDLDERLNKIYAFVYSENLEKGFQEEKEIKDKEVEKTFEEKQKEKEELEFQKKRERNKELLKTKEYIRKMEELERKEKYQKEKKEKEIMERIKQIEKTKPPKKAEVPKVRF